MRNRIFTLMLILMFSSSIAIATSPGKWTTVKDTIVNRSNESLRVKIDYFQYDNPKNGEENFFQLEVGDKISLLPTEEYYKPFSKDLGMRVVMEQFHKVGIPVVKQKFPRICKSVENSELQKVVISVCLDDQKNILKKWVTAKAKNLSSFNTLLEDLIQDNLLNDCLEEIIVQFFKGNNISAFSREKFPKYLKKQIEEGKKGYYETLGIDVTTDILQKY